jgi:Na+/melibiose symporter-like transporter
MASAAGQGEPHCGDHHRERPLRPGEVRLLGLLGVPTLALALTITTVSTYLPVHLESGGRTSTTIIGLLIGAEGLLALVVPLVVGTWSDQLRTPLGGRLPFMLIATPVIAVSVSILGFVSSVGLAAVFVAIFFAAYYVAYEPYRALYPDMVGNDIAGRAQSSEAIFRGAGTFLALVGGGLLIALAGPLPFLVAGAVTAATVAAFARAVLRRGVPVQKQPQSSGVRGNARRLWHLFSSRPELRLYMAANALWELSLGALKTFIALYLTRGLGYAVATSSLMIGGVAVLLLIASALTGGLADSFGRTRVMQVSLVFYGGGMLIPLVTANRVALVVAIPIIASGAGVLMTLPYALLMPMMHSEEHGALTGFYSFTRGLGTALGPLLAGVAIAGTRGFFSATHGYQAVWGICAAAVLLSLFPLGRLRRELVAASPRQTPLPGGYVDR